MKHPIRSVYDFGVELLETEDLDPVYCALYRAELPTKQLQRLLLAYFCFYHLGAAAQLSEWEGEEYWGLMENAAANEIPPNMNGDWPGSRWPRGSERRHFRGVKCVKAIRYFAQLGDRSPELVLRNLMSMRGFALNEVTTQVQSFPLFGPWIAFKVADILERVCEVPIKFPNDIMTFYDEPRAALDMLDIPAEHAVGLLLDYFRQYCAPPRGDRPCNIQEVETICCKWKSFMGGHYWIGKDIHEIRRGLHGWGKTAKLLLQHVPTEIDSDGSLFA